MLLSYTTFTSFSVLWKKSVSKHNRETHKRNKQLTIPTCGFKLLVMMPGYLRESVHDKGAREAVNSFQGWLNIKAKGHPHPKHCSCGIKYSKTQKLEKNLVSKEMERKYVFPQGMISLHHLSVQWHYTS